MAKVVAIAGLGDGAPPVTLIAWSVVIGTTIGIFAGTLLLNPKRKRGA